FMIRDLRSTEPGREADSRREHYDAFISRLRHVLEHGVDFSTIVLPPFSPPYRLANVQVQLGEESALGRVVDVFAPDRPGLLFALARAILFAGYSIEVARISTEGARAVDAFYLRANAEPKPLAELVAALARAATP